MSLLQHIFLCMYRLHMHEMLTWALIAICEGQHKACMLLHMGSCFPNTQVANHHDQEVQSSLLIAADGLNLMAASAITGAMYAHQVLHA